MATQVSARNTCWLDGITIAAQDLRLGQIEANLTATAAAGTTGIAATAGVRPGQGNPLACVWTSGMSFNLNAGMCFVQGSAAANSGLYGLVLDTTTLLTCTTSDPTNPRIDSVIAVVVDNGNNTSTFVFKILAGTPSGSPVAPTLPANALLLANISVGANVSTLSAGVFTDKRVWTVASGGILPYGNAALGTAVGGPAGAYLDDLNTGRLRRVDSSGNARAAMTAAFAPQTSTTNTNNVAVNPTLTTLNTVSITTDGNTEIEIMAKLFNVNPTSPSAGDNIFFFTKIDGTTIDTWDWTQPNTSGALNGAGVFISHTTPSAGAHTITFVGELFRSGSGTYSTTTSLRVSASFS